MLAPPAGLENYFLEIGFHPFDNDGIGFVYNFQDTNNYSRVLFVSEPTATGRIPQGLTVSRKTNGTWTDILAGDSAFIYRAGQPFAVEFANNNGSYRLLSRELDNPATVYQWQWRDTSAPGTNRFGLTTWAETDAHFLYARASRIPTTQVVGGELRITSVVATNNTIVLTISNPAAVPYDVQSNTNLFAPATWTRVASNQTFAVWTGPIPAGTPQLYWRLRRSP